MINRYHDVERKRESERERRTQGAVGTLSWNGPFEFHTCTPKTRIERIVSGYLDGKTVGVLLSRIHTATIEVISICIWDRLKSDFICYLKSLFLVWIFISCLIPFFLYHLHVIKVWNKKNGITQERNIHTRKKIKMKKEKEKWVKELLFLIFDSPVFATIWFTLYCYTEWITFLPPVMFCNLFSKKKHKNLMNDWIEWDRS